MDTLIMSKFRRVLVLWSFSLALLFVPLKAICQIAVPSWVDDIGGSSSNCISSMVQVDQQNNIFVTGFFSNTADFDPSAGVYNLTATGTFDTFLAKYTPAGKLIWAESMGGSDYTQVGSLSIDENGNPVICGQFDSSTDFDPGPGSTFLNPQGYDAFVAKYDTNGKFIWARNIGGPDIDYGSHVSTDSKGNVIACIRYQSTVSVGGNSYTGGGGFNGLTIKYDPDGNFMWGVSVPDPVNSEMFTCIDNQDNVLIGGHFTGNDNFNPLGTAYYVDGKGNSGFVAKYTPTGSLVWVNSFTGVQTDVNVGTDSQNNIVVVGTFSLPLGFNGTTLNPQGSQDIFLSKFTPAGVFQSLKDIGNPGANSIFIYSVVAKANNVYITGYFNGTIDFDPSPASQALVSYHGNQDFFFAKYDADFNYNWAFSGGSSNCSQALGRSVTIDNTNDVLVTGGFCSTVNFSPLGCTADPKTAQSFGSRDCFLGKYVQNVASAAGQITSFAVPQQSAPAVIDQTNLKITITVPAGTDVTALVPTIGYTSGVTLNPASGTAQNFTSNVTYNLSGSCASTLNYTVNVIVASGPTCPTIPAPTVVSSSVQVCAGTMATLSVSNPQTGLIYNWYSSTTSTTILATGSTISVTPSTTIPSYFVEGVNSNGCESLRTEVDVTSVPLPASPVIPDQTICSGSQATLAVSQPQGGITYNWFDAATGGTLLATSAQYTPAALTASTTYYTEADNSNGCSSARTATVINVAQPPQAPAPFTQNICTGSTVTLTLADAQVGTTYNWYDSAAKTNLLFTGNSYTTTAINANTTYYVEATNGTCPPSVLTSVNVIAVPTPAAPVVANNQQAVCASYRDLVLNIDNPQAGYTYNWYSSAASTTSLASGVSYDAATTNPTNTYYVEAVNSTGCISPRTAVNITVNPIASLSALNAFVCPGDATGTLIAETNDQNSTISWYAQNNGTVVLATGSTYTVPSDTSKIYYVQVVDNVTGCATGYAFAYVTFYPQLAAPVVSVGTITSTSVTFNWDAVQDATGYQVSADNGQTFSVPSSGSTGLSHTITGLQPGEQVSIIVQALGNTSCQLSTSSSAVTAIVQYPQDDLIYVANAFTPNGDGINDIVYVHSQSIKSMTFYIYDQWGEMLFESTSQTVGWDGTYKGKKQPVGVYVYFVKAVTNDGHQLTKKGTITLLK
jgi:gliding motility-associated-like protein